MSEGNGGLEGHRAEPLRTSKRPAKGVSFLDTFPKKTKKKCPRRCLNRAARSGSQAAFFAALNFAHLARCAAAILFRAAADIVLFLGMLSTFCFCPVFLRT